MERAAALSRRILPRGWTHFTLQLVLWVGFCITYLAVRSAVNQDPAEAHANGRKIITFEERLTHHLFELTAQRLVDSSHFLLTAAAWTYWNSEFTVMGAALLWVYLRRHERFARFRNTLLLANLIGLLGFALMPTAPPWMFPGRGFVSGVNHSGELIHALANQYAAMPSLHSAHALIVGYFVATNCRRLWLKVLWGTWPVLVWFCVVATANHYLLDVLAGIAVAVFSLLATAGAPKVVRAATRTAGPAIASIANLL